MMGPLKKNISLNNYLEKETLYDSRNRNTSMGLHAK